MRKSIFLCLAALTLSGCDDERPALTGNNTGIALARDVGMGCRYLGPVQGGNRLPTAAGAVEAKAMWHLMTAASAMGADTVCYRWADNPFIGATVQGDAYRCRGNPGASLE